MKRSRLRKALYICSLCLVLGASMAAQALAAEEDPYKYNALASLIGGCGTSKIDPIEDPGCPGGTHPPKKFSSPNAVATDAYGNTYIASYGPDIEGTEGRIDVFNAEGNFITHVPDAFGPKSVAIDSKGNLYVAGRRPAFPADLARYSPTEYEPKTGKIKYGARTVIASEAGIAQSGVAVDRSNDHIFVAQGIFISEYGSAEEGNKLIDTITHEKLYSNQWVAVDAERRRLYASSCPGGNIEKCWVIVLDADAPHELIEEVTGENTPEEEFSSNKGWTALAVDETDGSFFVGDLELTNRVYKFNEDYEYLSTTTFQFENNPPQQIAVSNSPESVANHRFLYVPSHPGGVGHAFAFEPPGVEAPEIESVSVGSIGETEAELQARVEPNGGETTYLFEYITQQAFEEKGFEGAVVAREGTLAAIQQKAKVTAPLAGLAPGTAYRFRVFVENEVDKDEAEGFFATYDDASIGSPCPNDALRTVFSANLPDCRAYELVTPPDTNGRIPRGVSFGGARFPTLEAAPSGNSISFLTEGGSLPGAGGAGALNGDLYRSTRGESGWGTVSAGPDGSESSSPSPGSTSPDQGYAFWTATQEGSAVIEGEETNYVHYPDGHSELVGRGSLGTDPRALGKLITEGGTHIVFETRAINASNQPIQLEPNAPPSGTSVVYDRIKNPAGGAEETKVVSLLPGNVTPAAGQNAEYLGASADGEGIAFSIGSTLYLRVDNAETFAIGSGLTYAGVSEGGARIFYLEAGDLKAFDTASEEEVAFSATGNAVAVNVAADGSRAYFVSTTALPGTNPNGASAVAGQRNLYLSEQGTISFVATVTERDVDGETRPDGVVDGLGLWASAVRSGRLSIDPSRLNPDGTVMLFSSRADLAGYDSEETPQIYRYDSAGERLHCISCIPTKQSATGGASLQSYAPVQGQPEPFSSYGFVPNLTPDGNRAFFESTEALVSTDNNGVRDVYEWEEQDAGSCTKAGGCVYLITSGHSDKDNYLYGHSASGDDVFFTTADILSGFDGGNTTSIYDARVGGGFAEPQEAICQEGDCRPASVPPPLFPTPASEAPVVSIPKRPPCPKGKKKVKRGGKVVCVKKKKQKKKQGKRRAGKTAGKGAGR